MLRIMSVLIYIKDFIVRNLVLCHINALCFLQHVFQFPHSYARHLCTYTGTNHSDKLNNLRDENRKLY